VLAIDNRQTDPDLILIADAWATLTKAVRADIVAIVKAAAGT
jgi:hypothetical protein